MYGKASGTRMATIATGLKIVVTGRHPGYTRPQLETLLQQIGCTLQQTVGATTDCFFSFSAGGRGKKYASWIEQQNQGNNVPKFDVLAMNNLLRDPVEFCRDKGLSAPRAVSQQPAPPRAAVIPAEAMIPQRKSMFSMAL